MKISLSIIIFLMTSQIALSQNYLMPGDQSGFHASIQFAAPEGSKGIGFNPGYTINGRTTVYLGFAYEKVNDFDLSSTTISPSVSYQIIDATKGSVPLNIELRAKYIYITISDTDLSVSGIALGPVVHYPIEINEELSLIPGATINWNRLTISQGSISESRSDWAYGFLVTLKYKQFYIFPALEFNDDANLFSLSAGYIF